MTNEECKLAIEWFKGRYANTPMRGAKGMCELAVEALEKYEEADSQTNSKKGDK